jgi:hypothetical protein
MTIRYLIDFCKEKIAEYPNLEQEIIELYQLAKDEMSDGQSEFNEVGLAIQSINELIEQSI